MPDPIVLNLSAADSRRLGELLGNPLPAPRRRAGRTAAWAVAACLFALAAALAWLVR